VVAFISTSTTDQNNRTLHLSERDGRDFVAAYAKYTFYKFLTIVDIIEEAALGIVEEGTKIGKTHEAEQLADQLRTVKHFGENSNNKNNIPPQNGQTCTFIYTMETFWYKLISSMLGNLYIINETHMKTLDPFIYLLKTFLRANSTANILTAYRSVNLTNQQIQQYIITNNCFDFT